MWNLFVQKTFRRTTWDRSAVLSPERRILRIIKKDLVATRKHSPEKFEKKKKVEEILTKEYQYKNSYQGKYCNPGNMYGPWYLESTINSYTKHLFAFDLFDEKNNYERIRFYCLVNKVCI